MDSVEEVVRVALLSDRALEAMSGWVLTEHDVLDLLTDLVELRGSQTAAARELGISIPYLNDILLGRRSVGRKVADGLGLRRVLVFVGGEWP